MAVRINDISGNVDKVYLATHVNQCHNTTDKEVFELVEETGEVITMGKVIGEPVGQTVSQRDIDVADACIEAAQPIKRIEIKMTWLGTLNALLALYTSGDREYAITKLRKMATAADLQVEMVEKEQKAAQQSPLLDVVDHLHKAAEIANGLVADYEGYESYTTDEDGDETETIVWEKAQVMIDKLQHVGGFNEDADELEDAQREIDEETQS